MIRKIYERIFGTEASVSMRIFHMIIFLCCLAALLGTVENMIIVTSDYTMLPVSILLVVLMLGFLASTRTTRFELVNSITGALVLFVILPGIYFFSGGIDGGATIWFILGIVYAIVMYSGIQQVVYLGLTLAVDIAAYVVSYYHPQMVTALKSPFAVHLDSAFSVICVGIILGWMLRFQVKVYEEERNLNLEQRNKLEELGESKNSFLASMSHELRTPINTIIGLNEMILRSQTSDEVTEYATDIRSASKMLLALVNDLLDLSQIEMKKMDLVLAEYKTEEFFRSVIDMMRVRMMEKNLEFLIDIDPNLPSILLGDEKNLKHILINILTNAAKYTEKGSVTLSAHVESVEDEVIFLRISVEDTGIGIRKEDLEHLYDSFKRLDTSKNSKIEGSGLGLTITKQLVDLLGGEITVDSIYTKGSTFTVLVAQRVIDYAPIGKLKFLERKNGAEAYVYQKTFEAPEGRLLIVDDNEMNCHVAKCLLQETKLQIDVAYSGKECLEWTKKKYYDVILMDHMMPEMNGIETLKQVRKQENGLCRETPVIAMTANAVTGREKYYSDFGFDSYLEKPIIGLKLEEKILQYLPEDIVEYRLERSAEHYGGNVHQAPTRRKKKICITTDCVSDLSEETLEPLGVKIMYLYIRTRNGRFSDTSEISSDVLGHFAESKDVDLVPDSVSVEEFEDFFAGALAEAEQVIHISMAKDAGESYSRAVAAAQGFDHVHIIDSHHISAGQGLVVMYAAKLAQEQYDVADICEKINDMSHHVDAHYILPDANAFYRNGYTKKFVAAACEHLQMHPMVCVRKSKMAIQGFRVGNLESSWKRFIRKTLKNKKRINSDIAIVTHADCSVRELDFICREIRKNMPFQRILVQRASLSTSCNSGIKTFGIAFYND